MDSAGHLFKVTGVSGKTRCFGDEDTWSITLENETGIEALPGVIRKVKEEETIENDCASR